MSLALGSTAVLTLRSLSDRLRSNVKIQQQLHSFGLRVGALGLKNKGMG